MDEIKFITELVSNAAEVNISNNQILYLFMLKHNINNRDISNEELLELVSVGYIHQGKLTDLGNKVLEIRPKVVNTECKSLDATLPKLTLDTSNIVKRLAGHFLGDMFKGKEYKRYNEDCGNPIMAPFFFIFMNMFPSSNTDSNKHWNKHFDTVWTNVNLRRVTTMTVKNFKKNWKSKDIGLFLLGTYLFIKGSHNQEKNVYFVKSLENFWKESDYWYEMAEDLLEKGELNSFTRPQKPQHQSNQFVI